MKNFQFLKQTKTNGKEEMISKRSINKNSQNERKSLKLNIPKTNLEKIIEILKEASTLLKSLNYNDMSSKVEWTIIEITSNDIYKYDINEHFEHQNDYLKIFSPEIIDHFQSFEIEDDIDSEKIDDEKVVFSSTFSNNNNPINLEKLNFIKQSVKITSFQHLINSSRSNKNPISYEKQSELNELQNNSFEIEHANCPINTNLEIIKNEFDFENKLKPCSPANKLNYLSSNLIKNTNSESFKRNVRKFPTANLKSSVFGNVLSYKLFGVEFDVFKYSEEVGRINLLKNITIASFSYKNCNNRLNLTCFNNFIEEIKNGYTSEKGAIYHNDFHAADVLQGVVDMIANCNLDTVLDLSTLDIISTMFAALIHDFKHPGFNNAFLINSKSKFAIQYNGNIFY